MPIQLSDDDKKRLIKGVLDRGGTKEDAFKLLDDTVGGQPSVGLGGLTPLDPNYTPPPMTAQETDEGRQFFKETLPRQAVQIGAGLAAAPLTGGMSLLPAAGIDFAASTIGDQLYGKVRQLIDPSRQDIPLSESAKIGALGAGTSLVTGGLVKGARGWVARRGGVSNEAIDMVEKAAPYGGPKAARMIKKPAEGSQMAMAERAQESAITQRAPSLPTATAGVKSVTDDIDTTPIFDHIMSKYRVNPVNKAEEAANAALEDLAGRLPQKMKMTELQDYLSRVRRPVKDAIGKEGGSMIASDTKDIQSFIRRHRDSELAKAGQEKAVGAFAASSKEIDTIKRFKKMLVDSKGNLKDSAEGIIRRIPTNRVILKKVKAYDEVAGTNFAEEAKALALKEMWNPKDYHTAGSLAAIVSQNTNAVRARGIIPVPQGAARKVGKIITIVTPPHLISKMADIFAKTMYVKTLENP